LSIREVINAIYADLPNLPCQRALENMKVLLQRGSNTDLCDYEAALNVITIK